VVIPASDDPEKGTALALAAANLAGAEPRVSSDLERDLPGASMFVYISHSEGLGSAILLAMSAGVPVVASRVGGIPEIVADGESGLLTGNTAQEIAAAIMRLRDREFAARLGERGRQIAEQKFTVATMVSGTIQSYERALQSRDRKGAASGSGSQPC
jgi:glycosyltransferase involved in cell wall biosynthesis